MNGDKTAKQIAARYALCLLPLVCLSIVCILLWSQQRELSQTNKQLEKKVSKLQAENAHYRQQLKQTREDLAQKDAKLEQIQTQHERVLGRLALEQAVPKGNLGELFLAYEQFAMSLRFEVQLVVEYRVHWRLADDALYKSSEPILDQYQQPVDVEKVKSVLSKPSRLVGVYLGRRSQFVFGLVMLPDKAQAMFCPTSAEAFHPPEAQVLSKRWYWIDNVAEYKLAENPIRRRLHIRVLNVGQTQLAQSKTAQVIYLQQKAELGFSLLTLGVEVDSAGVFPGRPHLSEEAWLATNERLNTYPMTAPNQGIVLHRENLAKAYQEDRMRAASHNRLWDYHREGWLRTSWEGIPGRIEVLFAPLLAGIQAPVAVQIHSLIFPMSERRAFWMPFWAFREQLLGLQQPDLARLPAFNIQNQNFDYVLEKLPVEPVDPAWSRQAYQTALYELIKHRPQTPK